MTDEEKYQIAQRIVCRYIRRHPMPYGAHLQIIHECTNMIRSKPVNQVVGKYGNEYHLDWGFYQALEMKIASFCKYLH